MNFNNAKVQYINGLPENWEGKTNKVYKLRSRTPHYNNLSKQYELDFKDRGRNGLWVFATPETVIDFHPDAASSFYLSHLLENTNLWTLSRAEPSHFPTILVS
ncbi:hypothetical protein ACFE04_028234 [Oxalis oulophora]